MVIEKAYDIVWTYWIPKNIFRKSNITQNIREEFKQSTWRIPDINIDLSLTSIAKDKISHKDWNMK